MSIAAEYSPPPSERFLTAWKAAVALSDFRFFGDGSPFACVSAASKEQLRPRWDEIEAAFVAATMSESEQIFLAHMLTFFNSERGGWPVQKYLPALPNSSLGHAAARLDRPHRAALANLIQSYEGW